MGLFDFIFGKKKNENYSPDFKLSEYDNWLNFIEKGGTSEDFKRLKSKNRWLFTVGPLGDSKRYQSELKPISDKYFPGLKKLQANWSALYNSKEYTGSKAERYIVECNQNIELYKKMSAIDKKYGHSSPPNVPVYKRLAMIYEKRGEYNLSIEVCREALINGTDGDGMGKRFIKMIEKSERNPTSEELALLNGRFN